MKKKFLNFSIFNITRFVLSNDVFGIVYILLRNLGLMNDVTYMFKDTTLNISKFVPYGSYMLQAYEIIFGLLK